MNTARDGLATAGKAGIVVVLIAIVLASAYVAPSMLGTGTHPVSTSSPQAFSSSSSPGPGAGDQAVGLASLFGYFSQMEIQTSSSDFSDPFAPVQQQLSVSYLVLGKGSLNSTQYTKVEFSTVDAGHNVIAWFSPSGGVDRVDVLGDRNYTGPTAFGYSQLYVSAFSFVLGLSRNATLLSILAKTSQNSTSFGPTKLDVTTYSMTTPVAPFASVTLEFATIPGTNTRIAVFFDEKTTSSIENSYQIISITE
jgi:hypothetical protein